MIENTKKFKELGISTTTKINKDWYDAGLLDNIDESFLKEVDSYWSPKTERKIDKGLYTAFMNLHGIKEPKLITGSVMRYEVLPVFNDYDMTGYYGDKNIYDLIIDRSRSAVTVVRSIRGQYFDADYNTISPETALELLSKNENGLIIKPSKGNNGSGIAKLELKGDKVLFEDKYISVERLLKKFRGNFIVQEMLKQHPNMAAPHPASVNTIRMVTFRWNNEIKYLLAFARFGSGDDIRDNANVDSSPRIGVKDTGEFFDFGIGQSGEKFTEHPTTGFKFSDLKPIPNYEEFKKFVTDSHKHFIHLDFVSWDIAVGTDGKPVFIEANFAGSTAFYQLVSQKPMFGDMTEEVMKYVKETIDTKSPKLMKKHRKRIEKKELESLKKELGQNERLVKELKKELNQLKNDSTSSKELKNKYNNMKRSMDTIRDETEKEKQQLIKERDKYKKKYEEMAGSTSWRITEPVRKVGSVFKKK
ncbi:sugar-transfer associated ATP-grasp domain-containing protein [Salinicoccus halitifaciens]|uniref:Alpha-L-glutamate ligase-related protein ATP-grasp domain-containing protein n=1 Tax=Salinicoccus halitifaciens TaxID=1073415 RepID=A0ABV2EC00_9STAP|nr:sugar-transfer associated ATP-grasp domain-containing protein [Salinicoccus halitifaciens]MCD2137385.1 hypothetical protein [Salinicoccus halitifaciens]